MDIKITVIGIGYVVISVCHFVVDFGKKYNIAKYE